MELPSALQLPATDGLSVGDGEFGATGAEKLIVIGSAPSTPVVLLAGVIEVRCMGPAGTELFPIPPAVD
jgi:hypothetical protein